MSRTGATPRWRTMKILWSLYGLLIRIGVDLGRVGILSRMALLGGLGTSLVVTTLAVAFGPPVLSFGQCRGRRRVLVRLARSSP